MVQSKNEPGSGSHSSDWGSSNEDGGSSSGSEYDDIRRKLFVPREKRGSVPQGMVSVLREKFENQPTDVIPDNLVKSRKSVFEQVYTGVVSHEDKSMPSSRGFYEIVNGEVVTDDLTNSNRDFIVKGDFEDGDAELITSKREVFETANGEVVVQQTSAVFRRESFRSSKSMHIQEEIVDEPVPATSEVPKPRKLSKAIRAVFENPEELEREYQQRDEQPKTVFQSIRKMFEQSKVEEVRQEKTINRRHTIHSTKHFTPGKLPASKREMFENASSTPNSSQMTQASRRQTIHNIKHSKSFHGDFSRPISGPSRATSVTGSQDGVNLSGRSRTSSIMGSQDGVNTAVSMPYRKTSVTKSRDGINRSITGTSTATSIVESQDGVNREGYETSKTADVPPSPVRINRSISVTSTSGYDTPDLNRTSQHFRFRREKSIERLPHPRSSSSRTLSSIRYDRVGSESEVFEDGVADEVDITELSSEPVFKKEESVPEGIVNMRRRLFENLQTVK